MRRTCVEPLAPPEIVKKRDEQVALSRALKSKWPLSLGVLFLSAVCLMPTDALVHSDKCPR
jgi:hypothetical protein